MSTSAPKTRKFPWIWPALLILVVAAAAGYALFGPPGLALKPSPLESWKTAPPDNRKAIADQIIERKTLIGMSLEEVIRDLGQPDISEENFGIYEWRVGMQTIEGRDEKDKPALQDETQYLKVKFENGRATMTNSHGRLAPHK